MTIGRWVAGALPYVLGCAILLALATPQASAQSRDGLYRDGDERQGPLYRPDQPAVLTPAPPGPGRADPSAAFGRWLESVGNPRMVIFWDRVLTDDVTTRYQDAVRTRSGAVAVAERQRTWSGSRAAVAAETRSAVVSRTEEVAPDRSVADVPSVSSDLEAVFIDRMIGAGARLIDRTTIIRMTAGDPGERPNLKAIEAAAMAAKADILLQVVPHWTGRGTTGLEAMVTATELESGRIVAKFTSPAMPPPPPGMPAFVASPDGGFERPDYVPSLSEIGEELAFETMERLAGLR